MRSPATAPDRIRDTCLALHLQRAARAVNRAYDDALRPLDLGISQFSLLVALSRPEPPTLGALAAELVMDRTTLTANLKPLEARKLVRSLKDPQDGRSRLLLLTALGRTTLEQAVPLWAQAQARLLPRLAHPDSTYVDLRAAAGL